MPIQELPLAEQGLAATGLLERPQGFTMGDSEDDVKLGEANCWAVRDAARWKIVQSGLQPGVLGYSEAVENAMLDLTALDMKLRADMVQGYEEARLLRSTLEPRQ